MSQTTTILNVITLFDNSAFQVHEHLDMHTKCRSMQVSFNDEYVVEVSALIGLMEWIHENWSSVSGNLDTKTRLDFVELFSKVKS